MKRSNWIAHEPPAAFGTLGKYGVSARHGGCSFSNPWSCASNRWTPGHAFACPTAIGTSTTWRRDSRFLARRIARPLAASAW